MEIKYKNLLNNSLWTIIGNIGSKVLSILLLPFYTKWLGTDGFGISDLITTYSSFLFYIVTLCVSDAIFVFSKNENIEIKKQYFTSASIMSIIMGVFWVILWYFVAVFLSDLNIHNIFVDCIWLILAVVFSTFWQQFSQQFILSIGKIKLYSFIGIFQCSTLFAFSYWMIPIWGVHGYVLSIVYSNLLTTVICSILSRLHLYFSCSLFDRNICAEMLKYSIPLIPNGIMWWLVSALNRPIMEHHLDFSSIGVFAVANRFPSVINMVFAIFSVAWNISVFEEFGKSGFDTFYKNTFNALFLFITIFACAIIVTSELIVSIFAASEFMDAWKYMIILIVGAVMSCMSSFFGTPFGVVKQSKYFLYSSLWGAGTALICNFLLIPYFGVYGASVSVVISFFVMMLSRYFYSKKYVHVKLNYMICEYISVMVFVSFITYIFSPFYIKISVSGILLLIYIYYKRRFLITFLSSF